MGLLVGKSAIVMQHGFITVHRLAIQLFTLFTFSAVLLAGFQSSHAEANETYVDYKSFQTYSIEHLLKSDVFNFDSATLERRLIETAAAHSTSPNQFHREIKTLIESEVIGEEYLDFEKKYNIRANSPTLYPDTITRSRLILMYPQYYNFDSRLPSDEGRCPLLFSVVPPIMRPPEFGGLVPTLKGHALDKKVIKNLVLLHLAWLTCNSPELRTMKDLGTELLKRMELSRLPDDMRVDLLQRKGIITSAGSLDSSYWIEHQHLPKIVADKLFEELR